MSAVESKHEDGWSYLVHRQDGRIVEAVAFRKTTYFFCGQGKESDLLLSTAVAAKEWGDDPYRLFYFGVGGDRQWDWVEIDAWKDDEPSPQVVRDRVVGLVASALTAPASYSTFSYPSRAYAQITVAPDPVAAAEVEQAERAVQARREAEHIVAEAADRQAAEQRAVLEAADKVVALKAERLAALNDDTPFTSKDLIQAASSVANESYLLAWGRAVIEAVEALLVERQSATGGFRSLLHLLQNTAVIRHSAINPFAGYLEAPPEIIEVYQACAEDLHALSATRDRVLDGLLEEIAERAISQLPDDVTWGNLAEHGAGRQKPPAPPVEDDC